MQSIYDDEKERNIQPKNDGSHDDLGVHPERREAETKDLDNLYNAESSPESNSNGKAEAKEKDKLSDQVGKGYTQDDSNAKDHKKRFRVSRRQVATGGIIGALFGGSFWMLTQISGPLQLVQLSKILGKSFRPSIAVAEKRLPKLYKYLGARSVSESRLSLTGKLVYRSTLKKFITRGIYVDPSKFGFAEFTVDIGKFAPDLEKLPHHEKYAKLAERLGVDNSKLSPDLATYGETATLKGKSLTIKEGRSLWKAINAPLEEGKIKSAVTRRQFFKAHNTPTLFHPFRGRKLKLAENTFEYFRSKYKSNKKARPKSKYVQKAKAAADTVREIANSKIGKIVGLVDIGVLAFCALYNIAEQIPTINWGNVVVPSMEEALETIGAGNQILIGGPDVTFGEIGARIASFEDEEGHSIWGSKALNALAEGDAGAGEDLDHSYRQAFSPRTTTAMMKDWLGNKAASAVAGGIDIVCGPVGQVVSIAVGLVLTVFTSGGWTGTKVVTEIGKTALMIGIISFVTSKALDLLTTDPAKAFSGPLGGGLLAYGVRAAENSNARMSGGVELGEAEEAVIWREINDQDREEFNSKGMFAKIFDLSDYKSMASTTIRALPTSPRGALASLAKISINPMKTLATVFGTFSGHTLAAEGTYNWGFPLYGIPSSLIEDSRLENPFENADRAAEIFESDKGESVIDRAKKCFGVSITNSPNGWDVVTEDDPNPAENEYVKANCDEYNNDLAWRRVMMFVYDTKLMMAWACHEGDDQSCQDIGLSGNAASGSGTSSGSGSTVVADGYAFPMGPKDGQPRKSAISANGTKLPCNTTCHHDGTYAFDLALVPYGGNNAQGAPVYAISDGTIYNLHTRVFRGTELPDCYQFQIHSSKDNHYYAYIHVNNVTVNNGDKVKAGQKIAEIGSPTCGDYTLSHLHIEVAGTPNTPVAGDDNRGSLINDVLNALWEKMPE